MQTLQKLWDLATELAPGNEKPVNTFGYLGLYLEIPLTNWGYFPTPTNSSTFAGTHGDSVHYGLLHINGEAVESSPVIMTVPCNFGEYNAILGSDLRDFLCLGCRIGYSSLEQLVYQPHNMIAELENPAAQSDEDERLLQHLISTFDLQPWSNITAKLRQLNETYLPLLQLPPED